MCGVMVNVPGKCVLVQTMSELEGPTSARDVRQLYALSLARSPESAEVLAAMMRLDLAVLVPSFFGSSEFLSNVVAPLREGRRLRGGLFDASPGPDLVQWAVEGLALTEQGSVDVLAAAQSWHALYKALFSDEAFRRACPLPEMDDLALAALERFSVIEGGVTSYRSGEISGWAIAPFDPDRALSLRAVVDGETICVAAASTFRRDIQDRFGGAGRAGFRMRLPVFIDRIIREGRLEVRDVASDTLIDTIELVQSAPSDGAYGVLRRELAQMRAAIQSIENTLPALDAETSYDLRAYGDRETALPTVTPLAKQSTVGSSVFESGDLLVVLDCRSEPAAWLDDAVDSIVAQTCTSWTLVLVGEGNLVEDLANRTRWRLGRPVEVVSAETALAQLSAISASVSIMRPVTGVVALNGGMVLEPNALSILADVLCGVVASDIDSPAPESPDSGPPDIIYWDEDHLSRSDHDQAKPWQIRQHVEPVLKSGFDLDLLLQEPFLGRSLAFRMEPLSPDLRLADLLAASALALGQVTEGASLMHLPWVLTSRQDAEAVDLESWRATVQFWLDRTGGGAEAVVQPDILGAPGGVKVSRREGLEAMTAAIIVPTRDRLDLLQPCIDSILQSADSNRVRPEIIVVDHESSDPETLAYLAMRAAQGVIRVVPHVGEFNWALMNNLAAAQTNADVLIFLNNDTAVITPDWLDELCGEAMRPGVGVVGARLIYADGAIQHAGFVARDRPEYFMGPEGMGDAGADGGYLGRHARLHQTAAVTGACMAVRRSVFESLGGFDGARLPVDWNDIDLCLRAQAAGLRVLYDPHATLFHFESRSRGFTRDGEKQERSNKAQALVWERWGERFKIDPLYNPRFDRRSTPFTRLRAVYAGRPGLVEGADLESMLERQEIAPVNTYNSNAVLSEKTRAASPIERIMAFVSTFYSDVVLRRSAGG